MLIFKDKNIAKEIANIFKPYVKKFLFIILTMIIGTVIAMSIPLIAKKIVDIGLIDKKLNIVIKYSMITLIIIVIQESLELIQTKYILNINSKIKYRLNSRCISKLLKVKMNYFDNNNITEIMRNISMDIENVSKLSDNCTLIIITEFLKFIGGLIGLFIIDYKLTFCVIIFIPIKYKITTVLSNKKETLFKNYMEFNSDYCSWFGNTMAGIREIKLWNAFNIKKREFNDKQRKIIKTDVKFGYLDKVNNISDAFLIQILITILYILGANMIIKDELSIGSLFAFITYSSYVTNPVSVILSFGYSLSVIYPSAKRLFDFLNMEDEDSHDREKKINYNNVDINGDLELKDVSFFYNKDKLVLKHISLKIDKGDKVILLGSNGSGKSTLIKLILGLYDPTEGNIYINNINLKQIKFRDYRNIFSVVNQDNYIFDGTVKENISLFSKDIRDIEGVCKKSGAYDFINKLPMKYETVLGKKGVKLSGGQIQRLAITRAMAKKSQILIFDEATSNCDFETQLYINDLVKNCLNDKTVIMITHKIDIELLKSMNKIVILDEGEIIDIGTHDELINSNNYYREIIEKYNDSLKEKLI